MIAIKHAKTGEVQFVASLRGYGSDWAQFGPTLPETGDLNLLTLVSGAWIEDAGKVEALLVAEVKAANEALVRTAYSTNFGKQKKYSRKQQEVLDFRALSGALGVVVPNALTAPLSLFLPGLAALSASQQKKKFRYVMAEAKMRGVTVDVVVGEIEARIDTDEDRVAAWEAVEQVAIRAIKAAPTAVAKRAVVAAISWPA